MFKKSRRKIVFSIMGAVALLFGLTIFVMLLASYQDLQRSNREMLYQHAAFYRLGQKPEDDDADDVEDDDEDDDEWSELPGGGRPGGEHGDQQLKPPYDDDLLTFYTVAFAEDGSVLAIENDKEIYSEEELIRMAKDVLDSEDSYGKRGALNYLKTRKATPQGSYELVVFLDNTVVESGMRTLLRNVLFVGAGAMAFLFFLSLWLAGRIIGPLEENDRKQKQFVSDASHELKTPVSVIGANAEMLSRELGDNEWLANIRYENDRMGDLVRQLLDLSRAESAEFPQETIDLSRIVTGEVLAFDSLAFEKGKILNSEIEEGIALSGSSTQLSQLVSILIDNALRHSTGKEIGITLKKQSHSAVLAVSNEGDAIPPEKLAHLFDRFYRVDEARNSEGQHYGLGLAIAKAVTEQHGGNIRAFCKDGRISFDVTLPVR